MSDGRLSELYNQAQNMSNAELLNLRRQYQGDQGAQDTLAPLEHQAFAREWTEESPFKAAVSLPFAIPAYTAAKYLGLMGSRSSPSLSQMAGGFKGLGQGLWNAITR